MKNLLSIWLVVFLIAGCGQDLLTDEGSDAGETIDLAANRIDEGQSRYVAKDYGSMGDGTVAIPFKAWFYSTGGRVVDVATCGAPPNFLNTQEGEGEGTGLGRMSFHATFCENLAEILDGVLGPGESISWQSVGNMTFTSANGDELWLSGGGDIVATDKPGYDFEFIDPFEFEGGTGRFEGASGSGVTESYVDRATGQVDHYWSGTLVLPQ